jgi:hypothetical protein
MAECGRLNADGSVSVILSWTRGTPTNMIATETIRLAVPGYTWIDIPATSPQGRMQINNLTPATPYTWNVTTTFTDGAENTSSLASFTTPTPILPQPATNLTCASP